MAKRSKADHHNKTDLKLKLKHADDSPVSHLFVTGLIHSIQSSTYQKGSKSHKDNTSFVFLFLQGFRVPCTWGPVQNQRALASPLFPHLPYMRASLHIGETSWISLCLKPFCSLKLNLIPKPKTKGMENWPRRQQWPQIRSKITISWGPHKPDTKKHQMVLMLKQRRDLTVHTLILKKQLKSIKSWVQAKVPLDTNHNSMWRKVVDILL